MKFISKISFLYSSLLGFYSVLVTVGMNPFVVLEKSYSIFDLFALFTLTFLFSYLLFFLSKRITNAQRATIMFCLSFSLPLIISGGIVWLLNSPNKSNFLLFVSTYFVASILPTLTVLITIFFRRIGSLKESSISFIQPDEETTYFELTNAKGKSTFKVETKKILYFESNDNYVLTFYLDHEENVKKSMDRLSLKSVEAMLAKDTIRFSRVHKSFLINPSYVKGISGRSQAYKIEMQHTQTEIPVSRKFDVSVLESNNQ